MRIKLNAAHEQLNKNANRRIFDYLDVLGNACVSKKPFRIISKNLIGKQPMERIISDRLKNI